MGIGGPNGLGGPARKSGLVEYGRMGIWRGWYIGAGIEYTDMRDLAYAGSRRIISGSVGIRASSIMACTGSVSGSVCQSSCSLSCAFLFSAAAAISASL